MAEDKISLAVLINNENIPTDIFTSSVDKYFGPQMEDFNKSSLIICILSDLTGWLPSENNVATYIKSQWLFMSTFVGNDIFKFKVAICDKRNWEIIAHEENIGTREIMTSHIECDKVFLVRINWNEPLTYSVESLTDLYSMDESFIKSHYECTDIFEFDSSHQSFMEPVQNLDTIKEDVDDNDSLNDSLQGVLKNDENCDMSESAYSLHEKVLELENDSLGNSQTNINSQNNIDDLNISQTFNDTILEQRIDETFKDVLDNDSLHDSIINETINDSLGNSQSNFSNQDAKDSDNINFNVHDAAFEIPIDETLKVDDEKDSLHDSIQEISKQYEKDDLIESDKDSLVNSQNNIFGQDEKDALNNDTILLKSSDKTVNCVDDNQSILDSLQELSKNDNNEFVQEIETYTQDIVNDLENNDQNIELNNESNIVDNYTETPTDKSCQNKIEMLNEKKVARLQKIQSIFGVKSELQTIQKHDFEDLYKTKPKKSEDDYEPNFKDDIQYAKTSTMIDSPCEDHIFILEPFNIQSADSKVSTDDISHISKYDNKKLDIEINSPIISKDSKIIESEVFNKSQDINGELKVGIISDEYCNCELFSEMEDEVQINVEFTENISPLFIPRIDETPENDFNETNKKIVCEEEETTREYEDFVYNKDRNSNDSESLSEKKIKEFENDSIAHDNKFSDDINITSGNIIQISFENNNLSQMNEDEKSIKNANDVIIHNIAENHSYAKEINTELTDDGNIVSNNDSVEHSSKDEDSENVDVTQPKVEDVVEMFEKLVLKEEEPLRCSKRNKIENENFNLLKQKFEIENEQNEDKLPLKSIMVTEDVIDDMIKLTKQENNENVVVVDSVNDIIDDDKNINLSQINCNDNNKYENKENEIFSGSTNIIHDNNINLKNIEHKREVKEIEELGRNLSIKEIKRIVKEKRQRLAVNDDYKYPDSVTPTKVEHSLSKSPEYNVPFMDDEAFYNESWYEESDDRWTSLERSNINDPDAVLLTPASDSNTAITSKASVEIFKETEDNKPKIVDGEIKKDPKKKGLIRLCGCVGGR